MTSLISENHFVLNKSGVFYLVPEVMYYEENSGGSFAKTKKQYNRLRVVF